MDAAAVISGVQEALDNPRAGRKWVREFISSMTGDDLSRAVEEKFDPVSAVINEYSLADPNIRPLASVLLKMYWNDISQELRSVPRMIKRLESNPENRDQLAKPETIAWLNEVCVRAYHILYLYTWPPSIDLKCAYCGAVFPFDVLFCSAIQFDGEGKKFHIFSCPACGKEVSAVL